MLLLQRSTRTLWPSNWTRLSASSCFFCFFWFLALFARQHKWGESGMFERSGWIDIRERALGCIAAVGWIVWILFALISLMVEAQKEITHASRQKFGAGTCIFMMNKRDISKMLTYSRLKHTSPNSCKIWSHEICKKLLLQLFVYVYCIGVWKLFVPF